MKDSFVLSKYQESRPDGTAQCCLCPHQCVIKPDEISRCHTRINKSGKLYANNYGLITAIALDPIEKKPLHFFHPGSFILSVGSFGCNFTCSFCQNWRISQSCAAGRTLSPSDLCQIAKDRVHEGNIGVAYTYNEPTVFYEYVADTAKLVHDAGLLNVLVTNGYLSEKPRDALMPYIDAMNIDLKSFTETFYQKHCKGSLGPVLETITACHEHCHVEISTLLIPGENDSDREVTELSEWLASISPDIPLNLNRYHPDYHMMQPQPISVTRLKYLAGLASLSLNHVVIGNV